MRVDRDEVRFLRDDSWVVHVTHRPQFKRGVLVEEVVKGASAESERSDRLGPVELLRDPRDDTAVDEIHDAVGEQLRVHAEVPVIDER